MFKSTLRQGADPVISAVLDSITDVSQIDVSAVLPDYKLGSDLGLSRMQIQMVLSQSATALGLQVPFEFCRVEDASPRELVQTLRNWQWSSNRRVA